MNYNITGCPRKKFLLGFDLISLATSSEESWDIPKMKGDIHRGIFGASSFLWDIRELRYRQNKTWYQMIKIVKFRLIPYS